MRILFVIPGSTQANAFSFSKEQVSHTQAAGVDTEIFFLESRLNLFTLFREYRRYRKMHRHFQPDIVHAHYGTVNGYFATLGHRKPFVVTFHGSDLNPADGHPLREKLGKFLSRKTARKANHIVCVSQQLKERLGIWQSKADIIPMGADDAFFTPLDRAACRTRLGLDAEVPYILFNGSNPTIKRTELAQAALSELKKTLPQAELVVLSGGVSKENIRLYLNACDALLVCSLSEGSPVIVKEAMACNLPVVSTDVGDIATVTQGCHPGGIVPATPQALAQGLLPVVSQNLRSNGREVLLQKGLTIRLSVEKLLSIYRTLRSV